jgi:murein L,D-transpeptidase YafK
MTVCLPVASAYPEHDRAAAAAARVRPLLEPSLTEKGLRLGDHVFIRIFKEERQLELWLREPNMKTYQLLKTWPVAAVSGVLGPKLAEGDRQAPEGFYTVASGALNPRSQFHLSFNLGFPNSYDRAHGRTGTFLMVHGSNLSAGCFAMTDAGIEEIYTLCAAALNNAQPSFPVHIFPFRMTPERLAAAAGHPSLPFWRNLQQGYDAFQATRIPPPISVADKRYLLAPPS